MLESIIGKIKGPSPQEIVTEQAWIDKRIMEIGEEQLKGNIFAAVQARELAYAPYSNYKVGASVHCISGNNYPGCNQETVSYSGTRHAEAVAISLAIMSGEALKDKAFLDMLVVCHAGDTMPCGECRQAMGEHAARNGNMLVINVNPEGEILKVTDLNLLLPHAFLPVHLGK